jgi:hypothetical protein
MLFYSEFYKKRLPAGLLQNQHFKKAPGSAGFGTGLRNGDTCYTGFGFHVRGLL